MKASVWRGKIQIVSSVMADDLLYYFSDEDDDENTLLDRQFDRWEQTGGGSARGPLFQFAMQPMQPLIILSILPSRLMVLPTPLKQPILLWGSFCNSPLDWMRRWPRWQVS